MPDWAIWLVVAAVLIAGELIVTAAILGPVGLAAIGAGVVAALGGSTELQVASFAVLTLFSLVVARPIAKRHLLAPPADQRTNVNALLGKEALVLESVDRDQGLVKIGGEVWSARSTSTSSAFGPGERVVVDSVHRTILHVSLAREESRSEPIA
jgi:membrane protein implicated in regulation of membrane protease activity